MFGILAWNSFFFAWLSIHFQLGCYTYIFNRWQLRKIHRNWVHFFHVWVKKRNLNFEQLCQRRGGNSSNHQNRLPSKIFQLKIQDQTSILFFFKTHCITLSSWIWIRKLLDHCATYPSWDEDHTIHTPVCCHPVFTMQQRPLPFIVTGLCATRAHIAPPANISHADKKKTTLNRQR